MLSKKESLSADQTNDYSFLFSFVLCLDLSPILFTVNQTFGAAATAMFETVLLMFGFINLFLYIKRYRAVLLKHHWVNINWILCFVVYFLIGLSLKDSFAWMKPYVMVLVILQLLMLVKYHSVIIDKPLTKIIFAKPVREM